METMPYLSISSSANLVVLEDGAVRSYPLNENQIWKIGRKIQRARMILNWNQNCKQKAWADSKC